MPAVTLPITYPPCNFLSSPSCLLLLTISTSTSTTTLTATTTSTKIDIATTPPLNDLSAGTKALATHKPLFNIHIPGLDPSSPYITSNPATNETMLITTAILSHPAIITWVSLFVAFLLFAGVVFALQKVMRRVRARRWIRDQIETSEASTVNCRKRKKSSDTETTAGEIDTCCIGKNACGKHIKRKVKGYLGDTAVYGSKGCEFKNGSDLSLRADKGVDERSGSWSKRRDKRFKPGRTMRV
ncbi:hypothetical protein TWF481_001425 [Arthrobotrys musiformis]|uniref:Copper transporter n=1 Tax=Arthrobotrys musiformis TaxID=47236 RepID=A0AAV9WSU1_9PEZI